MQKVILVLGSLILFIGFIFFVPRGVPVVAPAAGAPFGFWVSSVPQIGAAPELPQTADEKPTTLFEDRGYSCESVTASGDAKTTIKTYIQGQRSRTSIVTSLKGATLGEYNQLITGGYEYVWSTDVRQSATKKKVTPLLYPRSVPETLSCRELHVNPSVFIIPSGIGFVERIPGSR